MQKIRLRAGDLEIDTFQVGAPWRGGAVGLDERDGPRAEENSGNDHCTGPSEVLPTCATCDEAYDTCAETCDVSCYPCWTGPKPICLDG